MPSIALTLPLTLSQLLGCIKNHCHGYCVKLNMVIIELYKYFIMSNKKVSHDNKMNVITICFEVIVTDTVIAISN